MNKGWDLVLLDIGIVSIHHPGGDVGLPPLLVHVARVLEGHVRLDQLSVLRGQAASLSLPAPAAEWVP